MALTEVQRRNRIALDWKVVREMNGEVFTATAYRTTPDLERRQNPIVDEADASLATRYRVVYHVKTLIGPGKFSDETEIGVNLEVPDYPRGQEPATWITSQQVPWSPHFMKGAPVCTGEAWREARGKMLLGVFLRNIAKLLNWDEEMRGGGYVGWNGAAIEWHKSHYNGRRLSDVVYPSLPLWIVHGVDDNAALFSPLLDGAAVAAAAGAAAAGDALFEVDWPAPEQHLQLLDFPAPGEPGGGP